MNLPGLSPETGEHSTHVIPKIAYGNQGIQALTHASLSAGCIGVDRETSKSGHEISSFLG